MEGTRAVFSHSAGPSGVHGIRNGVLSNGAERGEQHKTKTSSPQVFIKKVDTEYNIRTMGKRRYWVRSETAQQISTLC